MFKFLYEKEPVLEDVVIKTYNHLSSWEMPDKEKHLQFFKQKGVDWHEYNFSTSVEISNLLLKSEESLDGQGLVELIYNKVSDTLGKPELDCPKELIAYRFLIPNIVVRLSELPELEKIIDSDTIQYALDILLKDLERPYFFNQTDLIAQYSQTVNVMQNLIRERKQSKDES